MRIASSQLHGSNRSSGGVDRVKKGVEEAEEEGEGEIDPTRPFPYCQSFA